jgi:hypothetical protein
MHKEEYIGYAVSNYDKDLPMEIEELLLVQEYIP